MKIKNYLLLGLVFLLAIAPIMAKDLSLNEIQDIKDKPDLITLDAKQVEITDKLDASYIVKEEGVFFKDLKQTDPIVYIDKYELDKNKKRVYHVDSKRNFIENETISLRFFYKIQPDTIAHYTHSGKFDRYFFPTQWLWEPNCPTEETCDGGWVTIEVGNIEEGYGSSTFPISESGPKFAYDGQFAGEFDGESSYINIENNLGEVWNNTNFTISLWAMKNQLGSDNPYYLFSHSQTDGIGNRIYIVFSSTDNKIHLRVGGPESGNVADLGVGEWHNIVLTFIFNESYTGYFDSTNVIGDVLMNQSGLLNDFIIGSFSSSSLDGFNGSIDEILIYNRTLSQAEITSLYNNYTLLSTGPQRTGTPSTNGLVLDINFDDYSVADNSGSGNHGTNTNVSFSEVISNDQTLVDGTDYSINTATGLFTILNDRFDYSLIVSSFDYEWYEDYGFHRTILRLIAGFMALIVLSVALVPLLKNKWGEE